MIPNIKGLIFDYGGTIDTNGVHWFEVFSHMYTLAGIMPDKYALREAYIFAEQNMEHNAHFLQQTDTFKEILQQKIRYQVDYLMQHQLSRKIGDAEVDMLVCKCYDFARKTVQAQRSILSALIEKYPMVLVSNFYGNLPAVLADFEIDHYFQAVIESAKAGVRKPDPELFRLGVHALNMPTHDVVVIGDSYKNDIAPAREIGCCTIWLKGSGWNDSEEVSNEADYTIASFDELLSLINN